MRAASRSDAHEPSRIEVEDARHAAVCIALSLCLLGPPSMYAQSAQPVVYNLGSGVVTPKVLKSIPPTYTPEARAARMQGTVTVEVVVLPDGKVGDARVARSELWPYRGKDSKDSGTVVLLTPAEVTKSRLDQQAIEAAKHGCFNRARRMRNGLPCEFRWR